MVIDEIEEVEELEIRKNVALAAGGYAVSAYTLGLPIGDMSMVTNPLGELDVACDLCDEIVAVLATDDTMRRTPVELLAKYALVLTAGDSDGWYYREHLNKIAKYVIAASFPRPLLLTSRAGKKALDAVESNWLYCIGEEAKTLAKTMNFQIEIVANALLESGSMSGKELQQLVSRVCIKRYAV